MKLVRLAAIVVLGPALHACAPVHSGSTYDRSELGSAGSVRKGEIVSVREVKVAGTESGLGASAGAIAGGTAGSRINGGTAANVIGAVGGAVIGGLVGAAMEQAVTGTTAKEFIVERNDGQRFVVVQVDEEGLEANDRVLILESGSIRITRDTTAREGLLAQ